MLMSLLSRLNCVLVTSCFYCLFMCLAAVDANRVARPLQAFSQLLPQPAPQLPLHYYVKLQHLHKEGGGDEKCVRHRLSLHLFTDSPSLCLC